MRNYFGQLLSLLPVWLAVFLAGCTPQIDLDLLNETGQTNEAGSQEKSGLKFVTVTNSMRIVLHGGNPLTVRFGQVEKKYSLSSLPEGSVRTTMHGLVVSVVLGEDQKLYLLDPKEKVPSSRLVPQPQPFPVNPAD